MRGLEADGRYKAVYGARGKRFAALRTWLRFRPTYLHYDWNTYYFMRRTKLMTEVFGFFFLLDIRIVRLLGCRVVWTAHQMEGHDAPFAETQRSIQRRFARLCEWVRVMGPSTVARAKEFLELSPDRIRVQPEGSFVDHYPNELTADECRRALDLAPSEFVFLFLGSIKPYKGVDRLVSTFASLPGAHLRLIVAGRCRDPVFVRQLEESGRKDRRILLHLGFVPDERVQVYMKACNVVVLPFEKIENSGTVILAMGFAKPVIAPSLGVLQERLAAQTDLLYEGGLLRQAMEHTIALGPAALDRRGERNRQALEAHRWEDIVTLFE